MKLIIALVKETDQAVVTQQLVTEEYKVTCIASTGGFLRRGLSTLLIGVDDEKLDRAMDLIKQSLMNSTESEGKRATIFVVNVLSYIHF